MSNTAAVREQHQNLSSTTLNGSINNSVTSITVTTGSVFPSSGIFRVMVEDEIMVCTARSSNTLTVVRGQDGTSAASHADLSTIALIYSSQSLAQLLHDNDPSAGYSSTLPQGQLLDTDGLTILAASDFTWQNQGGSTATDENGTILLSCPTDSSGNGRFLERTPTGTYTYIAAFSVMNPSMDSDAKPSFGVYFRETSSSKLMVFRWIVESFFDNKFNICVSRWSGISTIFTVNDGARQIQLVSDLVWVKLELTSSNIKFHLSPDGVNWMVYFNESKTAYFSSGPDRIGWMGSNIGNSGSGATSLNVRLHHWSKGE
jgi:hypothetical protein